MRHNFLQAASASVLLGLASSAYAITVTPQYTITEIGVLPGDSVGYAYGINSTGQVVGFSSQYTDPRFGPRHAYLYSN